MTQENIEDESMHSMQTLENGKKCERLSSGREMASQPQIYSSRGYLNKAWGGIHWPTPPEELWAMIAGKGAAYS